jgi:hypothetical protein
MSYYWALPSAAGPVPPPSFHSPMHTHSSLHQERLYLLSALANEESRGEQLTQSLSRTNAKLKAVTESSEPDSDAAKNLKKAALALHRKLRRSQKSQKAMIANLASVMERVQSLERSQWRRAHAQYSQQSLLPNVDALTMNMQNMELVSPVTPSYVYTSQTPISPYTPSFNPYVLPSTPVIRPQDVITYGEPSPWGSPIYTPFYEQQYGWGHGQTHMQTEKQFSGPEWQHDPAIYPSARDYSHDTAQQHPESGSNARAMSLPAHRRSSWWRRSSIEGIGENGVESISPKSTKSAMELGRRLSLVGGAGAGIRMGKLAERG